MAYNFISTFLVASTPPQRYYMDYYEWAVGADEESNVCSFYWYISSILMYLYTYMLIYLYKSTYKDYYFYRNYYSSIFVLVACNFIIIKTIAIHLFSIHSFIRFLIFLFNF